MFRKRVSSMHSTHPSAFLGIYRPISHSAFLLTTLCASLWAAPSLAIDSDGDGIRDAIDPYPCEEDITTVIAVPSINSFATVAFEDQWPSIGDYDFNDFVVDHNTEFYKNAAGLVTRIRLNYHARAMGALFDNGFAVRIPVSLASIPGVQVTRSVGGAAAAVVSPVSGETDLVVIAAQSIRNELFSGASGQVNTDDTQIAENGKDVIIDIKFASGVNIDTSTAPFDPFLFRSDDYSHQIHLPQFVGTTRMRQDLFGTLDDRSNASKKFVDSRGVPFALILPTSAQHPKEGRRIDRLFPRIVDFATSNGTQFQNFFSVDVDTTQAYSRPLNAATGSSLSVDRSCILAMCDTSLLDFEGLTEGSIVTDQFTSLGIVFSASGAAGVQAVTKGGTAFGFTGTAADTPLASGTGAITAKNNQTITMTFADSTNDVRFFVSDIDSGENLVASAFDEDNNLVATRAVASGADANITEVRLQADSIARITVQLSGGGGNNSGYAIDFLSFTRPCGTSGGVDSNPIVPEHIEVAQESSAGAGDFDANILGNLAIFSSNATSAQTYAYNIPNGSSYNGSLVSTQLEVAQLLFVRNADGLTLMSIQDAVDNAGGGGFNATLDLVNGSQNNFISVQDDPGEGYTLNAAKNKLTVVSGWSPCCTDGFAWSRLEGNWVITLTLTKFTGLNAWIARSSDNTVIPLSSTTNRRIRLRYIPDSLP